MERDFSSRPLGMRPPTDKRHQRRYGMTAPTPANVNLTLYLPHHLRPFYDQGTEGACVGFGWSWAKSIIEARGHGATPKFDGFWLYHEAQQVDEWGDTPPGEGTSVRAAGDILRTVGHKQVKGQSDIPPSTNWCIEENRWATTVDEVRFCINQQVPVVIGVNWYSNFDHPEKDPANNAVWWIGRGDLGSLRGGHCVCIYGASDKRQAVKIVNNWGTAYPLVWMPYETLGRLIGPEGGECTVITDAFHVAV